MDSRDSPTLSSYGVTL